MVGQTCRFAAAPSRAPPTISEMTFGNHSSRMYICAFGATWSYRHSFFGSYLHGTELGSSASTLASL